MYRKNNVSRTSIVLNKSTEGETIETKIERMMNNREPIGDNAPLIFTERKDGVMPGYDIRTDRFEVAIDAMDKVSKSHQARRADRIEERKLKAIKGGEGEGGNDSGAESAQGND